MKRFLFFILLCSVPFITGCTSRELARVFELPTQPQQQPASVRIMQFGDVMLDRNVAATIKQYGEDSIFSQLDVDDFFASPDIVSANLEGPFADYRRDTTKEIAFRFDPKLIPLLQRYHFSLFNLANNHTLDMGRAGFEEAKAHLQKAGIDFYGEQYTVGEQSLLFKEVNGIKLAFIGLNDTNSPIDQDATLNLIQRAEKEANVTLINIHWGYEYKPISNDRQKKLAHWFIDNGVDVVFGHHPHVVQEVEVYNDKPIFYSLGNFVFDQYFSTPTQQGLGVDLTVFKDGSQQFTLIPIQSEHSNNRFMTLDERGIFLDDLLKKSHISEQYKVGNAMYVLSSQQTTKGLE